MSNKLVTLTGSQSQVKQSVRQYRMENKSIEEVDYRVYGKHNEYHVCILKVEPYSPEEEQEMVVYGDHDHESYLLSEDYQHDRKTEKFNWIKNETT